MVEMAGASTPERSSSVRIRRAPHRMILAELADLDFHVDVDLSGGPGGPP